MTSIAIRGGLTPGPCSAGDASRQPERLHQRVQPVRLVAQTLRHPCNYVDGVRARNGSPIWPEPNGSSNVALDEMARDLSWRPRPITGRALPAQAERERPSQLSIAATICQVHSPPCLKRNAKGIPTSTILKEIVMNEAPQLEIVELGDAKEQTKGSPIGVAFEENPIISYRPED